MLLTVLGSDGTYPGPGSATAGFLLSQGTTSIWLDAGSGTFARLTEHISIADLDGIIVSHGHLDHCIDLAVYHHAARFGAVRLPPVRLLTAPDVLERLTGLSATIKESFEHRVVTDGDEARIGDIAVRFGPTAHSAPAVSIRLEGSGSLVYTGDTSWHDGLVEFSDGTDVLIAEATIVGNGINGGGHQSAAEAGRLASKAKAGTLLLTHIPPHLDRESAVEEAQEFFEGPVAAAEAGMTIEIGRQ